MKRFMLLFAAAFVTAIALAQTVSDTTAIKQLLEKESATWRAGNLEAHAACWQLRPYSKILVSTPAGKCIDVPPDVMIHPPQGAMGNGGSAINSNYLFSVYGNNAWVSHDEKSMAKDGTINYSHEIRMLEKVGGQWKLVAQSIHLYNPQPTTSQ